MTHEAGKGDKQRPTDHDKFAENYDTIWGKKVPKETADELNQQLQDDMKPNEETK